MSGVSDTRKCPICGKEMNIYSDWKPIDAVHGECLNCGFTYYTAIEQMSLKEINELRKENTEMNDGKYIPLKQKDLDKYKDDIKRF